MFGSEEILRRGTLCIGVDNITCTTTYVYLCRLYYGRVPPLLSTYILARILLCDDITSHYYAISHYSLYVDAQRPASKIRSFSSHRSLREKSLQEPRRNMVDDDIQSKRVPWSSWVIILFFCTLRIAYCLGKLF